MNTAPSYANGKSAPANYTGWQNWSYQKWAWEFLRRNKRFRDACTEAEIGSTVERQDVADHFGLLQFRSPDDPWERDWKPFDAQDGADAPRQAEIIRTMSEDSVLNEEAKEPYGVGGEADRGGEREGITGIFAPRVRSRFVSFWDDPIRVEIDRNHVALVVSVDELRSRTARTSVLEQCRRIISMVPIGQFDWDKGDADKRVSISAHELLKMLRTLDEIAAGVTQPQIAAALFASEIAGKYPDQIHDFMKEKVRNARTLADEGYRELSQRLDKPRSEANDDLPTLM